MKTIVKNAGYVLNSSTNVWSRPDYEGIAYSDGDENENRLAVIIDGAQDRSLHSLELSEHCTDWVSLYHLNKTRANVLRPFEAELKGKNVLEIGAGCGVITRYLGESGATVLALEGSLKRASIARSRTIDLENVTVVADRFSLFSTAQQFDFITFIGVLEYANLFTDGENPATAMLEQARSLLRPDGKIIIAIENQLGLKYFAGAPEDHLGLPMFGVEGRYEKNQPETFGRVRLEKILRDAGFLQQHFLAPFPDYKFPVSIITEQGAIADNFDASVFAWQSVKRDPQLPGKLNFSLELTWQEVFKNNLGLSLANSFLIVASPIKKELIDSSILAYHYSTGRIAEYCKETLFYKSSDNKVVISSNLLKKKNKEQIPLPVKHFLSQSEPYIQGDLLSLQLIRILTRNNWTINDVVLFFKRYIDILKKITWVEGAKNNWSSPYETISGDYFDAIPQNIILSNNQIATFFDKEWIFTGPFELGYLFFRALSITANIITHFGSCQDNIKTYHQLISRSLQALGFQLHEEDYDRYFESEIKVQAAISGILRGQDICWDRDKLLPLKTTLAASQEFSTEQHPKLIAPETEERLQVSIQQKKSLFKLLTNIICPAKKYLSFEAGLNLKKKIKNRIIAFKIERSGLFDQEWYLRQYPDVAETQICPILHYIIFGEKEGRNPNPLFESLWYKNYNPDLKDTQEQVFLHFITHGISEGRAPNSEFDLAIYLKENSDVAASGVSPVLHFLKSGYREDRIFSTRAHTQKLCDQITSFLTASLSNKTDKPIVFIFGHEASQTGAPLALLGIIKHLSALGKFYFVAILKRGGPLVSAYQNVCSTLILDDISEDHRNNTMFFECIAEHIDSLKNQTICLCNTAELSDLVEILGKRKFNIFSLIHEMPAAINEHFGGYNAIKTFEKYSTALILPSCLTQQRILKEYDIDRNKLKVIHPGVELLFSDMDITLLKKRIYNELAIKKDSPLVVSCGSYEYRKGFDLFITIGNKIILDCINSNQPAPTFLWVGPNLNGSYAQSKIAEICNDAIKQYFIFLDARESAQELIAAADAFFLCSREDPFPLVALEAAGYNVPIILFAGATGTENTLPEKAYYVIKKIDITEACNTLKKALKRSDYEGCSKLIREEFALNRYAKKVDAELTLREQGQARQWAKQKTILLIGYGPPPICGMKSEGSGLRLWGLAAALAEALEDHAVILAYKVALGTKAPDGIYKKVHVVRWEDETIRGYINSATTLIFSYCLGPDTEYLLSLSNPNQQVILDCYVPIFSEVCAREADDLEKEKQAYFQDITHWNNSLRRGDLFLCANQNQLFYYQGILGSLGRINPANYSNSCIRIVPYGIPETLPSPTEKPFSESLQKKNKGCIRLLWFGGVYPWFDTNFLLQAIKIISKKQDIVLGMVGAKNPFVQHETFQAKVVALESSIKELNLEDNVYLYDWVDYEKRADWYLDCDLIITINNEGFENTISWRTRLVDYVWSGMPVATNGGDPLGEDLISCGAAAKLDITSPEKLAASILRIASNAEALVKMKEAMGSYRPKLYWNNIIVDLVKDIKDYHKTNK